MQEEEEEDTLRFPHSKKKKVNQPQVMGIADNDLTFLRDLVAEVTEKILGNIMTRKTN